MPEQAIKCVSVDEFRSLARETWGAETRTLKQIADCNLAVIRDWIDFGSAPDELKVHLAETMIRESTKHCGSYSENGDPRWYLQNFARDLRVRNPVFDSRRIASIQAAIMLLAHQHAFLFQHDRDEAGDLAMVFSMGGAGVAGIYLLAQLEYLFRVKGNYVGIDGKLTQSIPATMNAVDGLKGKRIGAWINQIHLAFLLFLEGNADPLRDRIAGLEQDVTISARLARIRPAAMHGSLADPSGEGLFYALLMAMFYYSEVAQPQ